jgi:outer membrane receptor protein involved in Fe transport
VLDQTIEPTQVAGFNQFFDDVNGSRTTRYGIGLDVRLATGLYGGVELSRRELEVPFIGATAARFEDQFENLYRTYLYWTPHREWALSLEHRFEKLRRDPAPVTDRVIEVATHSVPATIRYFSPWGVFAELGATFVAQDIEAAQLRPVEPDSDEFVLLDAAVGYRLPGRRGILSLEARNLLDEEFFYQQETIQPIEPINPRFIPGRSVLFRATLHF